MSVKIAFFQTHSFEKSIYEQLNKRYMYDITFLEPRLTAQTVKLADGHKVVCSFANDKVDGEAIAQLSAIGVELIALRSAGHNHVDLKAAQRYGIPVVRVPAYSPHAVAEHAVCLLLALNRKIHRAYMRVQSLNFSLDGLVGFDLFGKTVGVIGTGKIGTEFAKIMSGFGCQILAYDIAENSTVHELKSAKYCQLAELYAQSDIISLHVPLTPDTFHLIDEKAFSQMKKKVIILNTGRGALINSRDLIQALKHGTIGSAGLDVYEEEEGVFFKDLSDQGIQDDNLARLLTFPNVLMTSHQGFLTEEALQNIAATTFENIQSFVDGKPLENLVTPPAVPPAGGFS